MKANRKPSPFPKRLFDEVFEQLDREIAGRSLPPADEVIRQMREARDAELLNSSDAAQPTSAL